MRSQNSRKIALAGMLSLALSATAGSAAFAQMSGGQMGGSMATTAPMVGGAAMYPTKTIVQNAIASPDHTTLVAAVKAAGLVDTLNGAGPFTVFAPTNEAFDKLPPGTVTTLTQPENKAALTKILTYHVVSGSYSTSDLMKMIKDGGGTATLTTVQGEPLTLTLHHHKIVIHDQKGGEAHITVKNVVQSNGMIQVIDGVLMPS